MADGAHVLSQDSQLSQGSTVADAISTAPEHVPEPPRPLVRQMPPPAPFPAEALGPVLQPAAEGIHERVQAPIAICGTSVLAAAALATQAHANIELPGISRPRPLSLFFVTVAESGERKSATDDEALWPVGKREEALRERYDDEIVRHQNELDVYRKQRDGLLRDAGKKPKETRHALEELGAEPVGPLTPILTCDEPTFEGLCRLLAGGQPSIGVFSDEGATFVGGHALQADAKLRSAGGLSKLWDGAPIRRVRAGDGATILPGRRVALHLMMQPDVAMKLLTDPVLRDQGLLSRILPTAPTSASGTRFHREVSEAADEAVRSYGGRLLKLLEHPPRLADGTQNELQPRSILLDAEARDLWIAFKDHVERALRKGGQYESILGLANKLPEHAGRIAGVLELVQDPDARAVGAESLSRAILLAQHYADEALRLHASAQTSHDLIVAELLRVWIRDHWTDPLISLPDIYQRGPGQIREAKQARSTARILVDHGWLVPIEGGADVRGTFRNEVFQVVRVGT